VYGVVAEVHVHPQTGKPTVEFAFDAPRAEEVQQGAAGARTRGQQKAVV
jgi:hypothetical protein